MEATKRSQATITAKTAESAARPRPKNHLKTQKSVAKIGMAGSLGTLFVSGFFKFHGAKQLHVYSGFGLLAFTLWHHVLNQPSKRQRS